MPSQHRVPGCRRGTLRLLGVALSLVLGRATRAAEPAVTVLTDFEDRSVAASIAEVRNVLAGDCAIRQVSIPARGRGSLGLEIGATAYNVSVACDLTFRAATRFEQPDHVATFCWINEGQIELAFRVRDLRGQLFETRPQPVELHHRWVQVTADLSPQQLRRVGDGGQLTYPLEIQGYRVTTSQLGKQTIYLDDLQVEHRVEPLDLILGGFEFNEPTRIYEPGSTVAGAVVLENRSRRRALYLYVNLAWIHPDGSVLPRHRARVSLPAGGNDYRSYQKIDFSQVIREPGLYRLVASARAAGWTTPKTFETTIAVTRSNRRLSRGRSTFFGVRSNLLREPDLDQTLEISVARDIGVNLLALDTPWRRIEPKPGSIDYSLLDRVLRSLARQDIAAMVVLTDPPDWLGEPSTDRPARVARLINALAARFGARLQRFQLDATVLAGPTVSAQLDAARQVLEQVRTRHAHVELLPPPIAVDDPELASEVAEFANAHPTVPLLFQTRGETTASLAKLAVFQQRGQINWGPSHWWLHDAPPLRGAGHSYEAEAVFRHYVQAAAAGVGGLIWFDLRDDDNDPKHLEALRGLVRRDFSPRASLLGYAAAAGQLTGNRYLGQVFGAPDTFDSWLFIGANRQTAVLLPRPNRLLPAVLAPVRWIPGEFDAQDFERRPRPLLTSAAPLLIATIPRPLFVTLALKQAEPDPQLGLGRPWLRVPATVLCGVDTEFTVEIDAPVPLQRSYLQLKLPSSSPVESSLSAMVLRAAPGDTLSRTVRLTPKPDREFERAELTLRISLEGEMLEVPLEVRPLTDVRPLVRGIPLPDPTYRIADLATAEARRATATAALYCGYDAKALHLTVVLDDDRVVPYRAYPNGQTSGDQLLLGVAREGSDTHAEVRIDPADASPTIEPLYDTTPGQVTGWRCRPAVREPGGPRTYRITIPGAALGADRLAAGDRFLLAVRYLDDDSQASEGVGLGWGGGLDGSRSTTDYRWVRLAGTSPP